MNSNIDENRSVFMKINKIDRLFSLLKIGWSFKKFKIQFLKKIKIRKTLSSIEIGNIT